MIVKDEAPMEAEEVRFPERIWTSEGEHGSDAKLARERAFWAVLAPDERAEAARRLSAIAAYETGERKAWEKIPKMKRANFFKILKRWRADRSLVDIVPAFYGRSDRATGASADARIRETARNIMQASSIPISKQKTMQALRDRLGQKEQRSDSLLWTVVNSEYASIERERLGGHGAFGRRILCDTTIATIRSRAGETGFTSMLGVVIDVATCFILGFETGTDAGQCLRSSARTAAQYVKSGLDEWPVQAQDEPVFTVAVGEFNPVEMMREINRLGDLPSEIQVKAERKERAAGARLTELLGPSVGYLDFRPRHHLEHLPLQTDGGDQRGSESLEPAEIVHQFMIDAVSRHNRKVREVPIAVYVDRDRLADGLLQIGGAAHL